MDEAVIRVIVQGSKGTTTGGAEGTRSGPESHQLRAIDVQERGTAQSLALTRSTTDAAASMARLEKSLAELARGGGRDDKPGIARKVMSGIFEALNYTVVDFPKGLVKDFGRHVYKNFSDSLIGNLGGDAFGKQLGKHLADAIKKGFGSDKSGDELGTDAADAVADFASSMLSKFMDISAKGASKLMGVNVGGLVGEEGRAAWERMKNPPPARPRQTAEESEAEWHRMLHANTARELGVNPEEYEALREGRDFSRIDKDTGIGPMGGGPLPRPPAPAVGDADFLKQMPVVQGLQEVFGEKKAEKRRKAEEAEERKKDREFAKRDAAERAAIEITEAEGAPPTDVSAGQDIPEFAKGGKVGKTGLAYLHADETVVPIAEKSGDSSAGATGGPGELKSDLDAITEALGRGPALREVPVTSGIDKPDPLADETRKAINEVVYVLKSTVNVPHLSKLTGPVNVGPLFHKSVAIGPENEPPLLADGSLNPNFRSYGHPGTGGRMVEERGNRLQGGVERPWRYGSADKADAEPEHVRRAMKEFNKEYDLFGANCQHAADDVLKAARSFGAVGGSLPEAEPVESLLETFSSFKVDKWKERLGLTPPKSDKAPAPPPKRKEFGPAEINPFDAPEYGRDIGLPEALPADDPDNLSQTVGRGAARALKGGAKLAGKAVLPVAKGAYVATKATAEAGVEAAKGFAAESPLAAVAIGAAGAIGVGLLASTVIKDVAKTGIGVLSAYKDAITSPDTNVTTGIMGLGQAMENVGSKIPIFGESIVFAGDIVKTFGHVLENVSKLAEKYGEYSPEIAQSLAIADMRQTMGDMQRANRIAGEMAEFVAAKSDLQAKYEETKIALLEKALPSITHLVEYVEVFLQIFNDWIGAKDDNYDFKDPTDMILHDQQYMESRFSDQTDRGYLPRK